MRMVDLPSGRKMRIDAAPFAVSRDLFKTFLSEIKIVNMDAARELDVNFLKDLICTALGSKTIEDKIMACMKWVLIDDLKVEEASFEAPEHRQDYIIVMVEVAKENLTPFTNSLFAQSKTMFGTILSDLA